MTFIEKIYRQYNRIRWLFLSALAFIVLGLSSCASRIPVEIQGDLDAAPTVAEVHAQPETFLAQRVRWGGKILAIENKQNTSRLTVVAFPLNSYGRPKNTDQSPGRFIAIVDNFLEPELYSKDREITVTGSLQKSETIKVGDFPYNHPVVQVDNHYLWSVDTDTTPPYYEHHWWHDSWYNPYYPWPYPHHLHTY